MSEEDKKVQTLLQSAIATLVYFAGGKIVVPDNADGLKLKLEVKREGGMTIYMVTAASNEDKEYIQ